jgi:cell division protein FtsB
MKQYLRLFRWKRSRLLILLCTFAVIWFLFFDTHSFVTKLQLENQKEELIERTEEYRQKTAELEQKIEDLENNPELVEKIAREDYGMKKADETVYKIQRSEE